MPVSAQKSRSVLILPCPLLIVDVISQLHSLTCPGTRCARASGRRNKSHFQVRTAVMSLRKCWFSATLITIVGCVAVGSVNRPAVKGETQQTYLLPIQSKDTKSLGVGKVLVASRDLGDPNFAETVILLVHYDTQGVVGLGLNPRTEVPGS